MKQTLLSLSNLSKQFGGKTVLDGLDLEIYDGEFITLLGPSGCGKTTLLRLMAGFEHPDGGTITLAGDDLTHTAPENRPLNTVFQHYALFPHMSVFDNVAYGLKMEKRPKDEIRQRVDEALAMVQLQDFARRKPHQLSGGQQQRVAIARAVVKRPRLLLLDEPLSALDYKLRRTMQVELKRLQRELGITFVFVTHDQEEALSMSDRVVVLKDGVVQQLGTPRKSTSDRPTCLPPGLSGRPTFSQVWLIRLRTVPLPWMSSASNEPCGVRISRFAKASACTFCFGRKISGFWSLTTNTVSPARLSSVTTRAVPWTPVIHLDDGTEVLASEFFDEDDPAFDYRLGEPVKGQLGRRLGVVVARGSRRSGIRRGTVGRCIALCSSRSRLPF